MNYPELNDVIESLKKRIEVLESKMSKIYKEQAFSEEDSSEEVSMDLSIYGSYSDFVKKSEKNEEKVNAPGNVAQMGHACNQPEKKEEEKNTVSFRRNNEFKPKSRNKKGLIPDGLFSGSWMCDMPGERVSNVKEAVSLNDKFYFVSVLFRNDLNLYETAMEKVQSMNTLDELISFMEQEFPEWDPDSEEVYKFIMTVRRKIG